MKINYHFFTGLIVGFLFSFIVLSITIKEYLWIIGFLLIFLGLSILFLFFVVEDEYIFLIQPIVRYLVIGGIAVIILELLNLLIIKIF